MARGRDTEKGSKPYAAYPLITESEHDELMKVGQRKWPRTLSAERGAELEGSIDRKLRMRKRSQDIRSKRISHPSFKYTSAGRRAAKRIPRKSE